jgi:hypothetical protein
VRLAPARAEDAEALTDLHLDVWDEAYADLVPASVFADRSTDAEVQEVLGVSQGGVPRDRRRSIL